MGELRRALACSAAVAAAAGGVVVVATPSQAVSPECSFFDFRSAGLTSLSRLVRVDLPAGTTTDLGRLDYQVQAAGYSSRQELVYGVATRDKHGWLLRRPRLLTINSRGTVTDLGDVRRGVGGLAEPVGGAVSGTRFYVRDVHRLFTIDIDPGSPTYRKVVGDVRLKPVAAVLSVDDFGVSPVSGTLYGVSTTGYPAKLVSIDPVSGSVRTVASVPGIPRLHSYSSVLVGASGVYAVNTGYGRPTRVFRIGFDGSSRELGSWQSMAFSEGAGCLPRVAPPPPPPPPTPAPTPTPQVPKPTPRPTATPTPAPPRPSVVRPTSRPTRVATPEPTPTPAPTPTPTAEPQVVAPPPPSPTPTPPPTVPRPPAVPPKEFVAAQQAAAEQPVTDHTVQVMRRWSLATVILIMSGGAAMAASRRMRRR
ncbi:hypothetical protein ABZS29_16370 [Kribbella sp. NPDC005582]|uniref:DUF6923 family protein n=1 Tax=Kribbella sp. NPDC005582 TaxID=3156893 RepID=UPI0033AE9B8C